MRNHIHVLLLGNRCTQKNNLLKNVTKLTDDLYYIVGNCSSVKLLASFSNKKETNGALISERRSKSNYV